MKNEKVRSARNLAGGNVRTDQNSDHMHQEYLKQVECKSKWLWHLRLKPDLIHEKEGVVAVSEIPFVHSPLLIYF